MTAQKIINRALRLCRVLDAGEAAAAGDSADALDTLNAMLAEWHFAEVGLPDYSLSSLTEPLASDAADMEAIAYMLAIRIAPEYGVDLPMSAITIASDAMGRLRLRYFQPGLSDSSELPGRRRLVSYTGNY